MANIRGIQGGQAAPVAITAVEAGVTIPTSIDTTTPLDVIVDSTIPVDVKLAAGENHAGALGGNSVILEFSPTLSVAGAYISGDYIGESGVCMSIDLAGRINGGTGIIESAVLIDAAKQSAAIELWLFTASVTPPNDNAPWDVSDLEATYCIGVITFDTYYASVSNSVSSVGNVGLVFKAPVASQYLFGVLVSRGTPTFAAGNLTIKLGLLQD